MNPTRTDACIAARRQEPQPGSATWQSDVQTPGIPAVVIKLGFLDFNQLVPTSQPSQYEKNQKIKTAKLKCFLRLSIAII
jgi:hypothetical protein